MRRNCRRTSSAEGSCEPACPLCSYLIPPRDHPQPIPAMQDSQNRREGRIPKLRILHSRRTGRRVMFLSPRRKAAQTTHQKQHENHRPLHRPRPPHLVSRRVPEPGSTIANTPEHTCAGAHREPHGKPRLVVGAKRKSKRPAASPRRGPFFCAGTRDRAKKETAPEGAVCF